MAVQTPHALPQSDTNSPAGFITKYPGTTREIFSDLVALWKGAERLLDQLANDHRINANSRVLHIGTTYEGILTLMDPEVARIAPIINGDGWQAWDEDLDADINDGVTQHVKFFGNETELWQTYHRLVEANVPLIPMGARAVGYSTVVASFSDWEDDSYEDIELLK